MCNVGMKGICGAATGVSLLVVVLVVLLLDGGPGRFLLPGARGGIANGRLRWWKKKATVSSRVSRSDVSQVE
jgi:hypothetical protein